MIAARLLLGTLRWSPLPVANALARFYAGVLDVALPRLRRTAYSNLAFALPGADARSTTDGVFRSIARVLVAFARFPLIDRSNVGQWIRYEGLENYHAAKARGCGVLVATGHIGNWELSAFAHALLTEPMHIVVRPLDNRSIDSVVEERRRLSGNSIIEKKDAARNILRALQRNEAVGILIDQNASLEDGVFVPFFGRLACANKTFARLANHTGAAVIPGYAVWSEQERKYVLHFEPAIAMSGDEAADTASIQSRLETVIRRYPDQWLWIHRRWKTQPE